MFAMKTLTLHRDPVDELQARQDRVDLQDICDAFAEAEETEIEKLHVIALEEED